MDSQPVDKASNSALTVEIATIVLKFRLPTDEGHHHKMESPVLDFFQVLYHPEAKSHPAIEQLGRPCNRLKDNTKLYCTSKISKNPS
ncbi:hypothetical protein JCM33374_g5577 [Metschnikowia sp. JCM 33374]|nr:hypothetical protein JCM33374_g5577 [Metschnikowia sp. JCM 33374]